MAVGIVNAAVHTGRPPTPVDRHGDGVEGVVAEDTWVVAPLLRQPVFLSRPQQLSCIVQDCREER